MDAIQILVSIIYAIACLFLIMLVLLRKSENASMGSAFGVGGESPFGVKTQQALDKLALYATIAFFTLAIFLSMYPRLTGKMSDTRTQGSEIPRPFEE